MWLNRRLVAGGSVAKNEERGEGVLTSFFCELAPIYAASPGGRPCSRRLNNASHTL